MVVPTFIDQCVLGYIKIESIDRYIEEWHTGKYSDPLFEFLGMTQEEYSIWVTDESYLRTIINNRMTKDPTNNFVDCYICKGTGYDGYDRSYPPNPYLCDECNGIGKVTKDKFIGQLLKEITCLEKQID